MGLGLKRPLHCCRCWLAKTIPVGTSRHYRRLISGRRVSWSSLVEWSSASTSDISICLSRQTSHKRANHLVSAEAGSRTNIQPPRRIEAHSGNPIFQPGAAPSRISRVRVFSPLNSVSPPGDHDLLCGRDGCAYERKPAPFTKIVKGAAPAGQTISLRNALWPRHPAGGLRTREAARNRRRDGGATKLSRLSTVNLRLDSCPEPTIRRIAPSRIRSGRAGCRRPVPVFPFSRGDLRRADRVVRRHE
jgi:hypothetical protein